MNNKKGFMNLEANHARHRREQRDAQPFFSVTMTLCVVPSAYFLIKGVLLTAQATSIMGAVAGLTVALFGGMLVDSINNIMDDRIYNRSI